MNLRSKYIRKAIRYLKERNEYDKNIINSMICGIEEYKDLPHIYFIGNNSRHEYLKIIKSDLINDILKILNTRLNLISFKDFKLNGISFKNKNEFIYYIVSKLYVQKGMNELDNYLYKKKHLMSISSLQLLKNEFCSKV